jgi:hypothetical protein
VSGLQDIGDLGFLCFMGILTLRYDPGIPSVMPVAGGCLTMKKQCDARLYSHDAWLFLLTLVTFSYF